MTMTWKKSFIALLIIWVSLVSVYGQEKADSTGKSFLWQVEGTAGKSYLLGSVHLLKKEHYPLKKPIEDAFAQTDVIAVEADVSGEKMMKDGMKILQKGMYQDEETLKNNISEKTYQLAEKKLEELGMNIEGLQKFKPWMVAMTITSMGLVKMGFNPNYGIDKYFLDRAVGKKEIAELEGLEFQMKLFDGMSKEENDKFLLSSILEVDRMEKEMDKLISAWIDGDVERLETFFTENIQKYPELKNLYKKMLDGRNERMVEKIVTYLKSGKKYLIVVGAGHMVGKKGIVQLLKNKGIKVEQL
jgi:uncharacterized protein YbaP (TraB family)